MFKRVTWLGVGFTLGAATTVVAARKARQQLDRYKPPALVDRVTTTISTKTTTLKDQVVVALNEGRSAAKDRETELREEKGLTIVPDDTGSSSSSPFHVARRRQRSRSRAALEGSAQRENTHQARRTTSSGTDGRPRRTRPGSKSHAEERGVQGLGRMKGPCRGTSTATSTPDPGTPGKPVVGGGYDLSRVPAPNRR